MQTYLERYGAPTNELEKYLYNGAEEIISRGGRCLVSKLPYDNESKDKFAYTKYRVGSLVSSDEDEVLSGLKAADPSISSYLTVSQDDWGACVGLMTMQDLDRRTVSRVSQESGSIEIVDISRSRFGKMDLTYTNGKEFKDVDCLGIFPVLVGAANAAFYQGVIQSQTSSISGEEFTVGLSAFSPVADVGIPLRSAKAAVVERLDDDPTVSALYVKTNECIDVGEYGVMMLNRGDGVDTLFGTVGRMKPVDPAKFDEVRNKLNEIVEELGGQPIRYEMKFGRLRPECLATPLSAATAWDDCVSYRAVSQFPRIGFARSDSLEREYLKKVGLVVFEARRAEGDSSAVEFVPLESYVGSLDRNAKSSSGASEYLGDVVNSNSRLIRFFSNVRAGQDSDLSKACAISTSGLIARVLGFYSAECEKKVS